MSIQTFDFERKIIDFDRLEQIFVSLVPDVFSFFNKDLEKTNVTVYRSESLDFYEDSWSEQYLKNDTISIRILQQSRYYDNSMTAQWLYDINLSIQFSTIPFPILRLFINSLSMCATCKLFYESNPEYQAFVDYYLERLRLEIQKSN
jgi:hypothetical protein